MHRTPWWCRFPLLENSYTALRLLHFATAHQCIQWFGDALASVAGMLKHLLSWPTRTLKGAACKILETLSSKIKSWGHTHVVKSSISARSSRWPKKLHLTFSEFRLNASIEQKLLKCQHVSSRTRVYIVGRPHLGTRTLLLHLLLTTYH